MISLNFHSLPSSGRSIPLLRVGPAPHFHRFYIVPPCSAELPFPCALVIPSAPLQGHKCVGAPDRHSELVQLVRKNVLLMQHRLKLRIVADFALLLYA